MAKDYSIKATVEVVNKAVKPLNRIGAAFTQLSGKIDKMSKNLAKAGKKLNDVGKSFSTKLTLPLVGLGTAALKMSFDFNESMANIATLIPGNIKRVEELKTGIQDMAVSVGKSTGDLADGMYQVISAFGNSADAMSILETNAKAATAGLSSTTDAINLTSAVTKAYGDTSAKAVKKAADLGLLAVRLGQTDFPQLAASIGRVTPLAAQLNITQEELFSGFATLTGVTGGAAEVSTQMAAILRAMLKPTTDMTKAARKLGFESTSQMIKQRGLVESLKLLMKYTGGNEEQTAKLFGRAEALTAVFALSGSLAKKYAENLNELTTQENALEKAFKEVTDGINKNGFTWKQFLSLLQVVGQEIGDMLGPLLVEVVGHLREWIKRFRALSPETKKMILLIGGIVAAIGPALIIIGKFATAISAIIKLYKLFRASQWLVNIAMAANPVGIIIIGITALIALIVIAIKNWNKFGAAMMLGLGPLGMTVSLFKTLYDRWESIKQAFKEGGIIGALKEIGKAVVDSVIYPIQQLLEIISKIPGVGKFAKIGAEKISKFRESFLKATAVPQRNVEKISKDITKTNIMKSEVSEVNIKNIDKNAAEKIGESGVSKIKIDQDYINTLKTKNIQERDYTNIFKTLKPANAQAKTEVEVKVSAEDGSNAVINKVKSTGKPKIKIQNESNFGRVYSGAVAG